MHASTTSHCRKGVSVLRQDEFSVPLFLVCQEAVLSEYTLCPHVGTLVRSELAWNVLFIICEGRGGRHSAQGFAWWRLSKGDGSHGAQIDAVKGAHAGVVEGEGGVSRQSKVDEGD